MKNNEPPSKEFLILLKEVTENRVLIETLYKSMGVSDEKLKELKNKIEPIVDKVTNDYLKDNY